MVPAQALRDLPEGASHETRESPGEPRRSRQVLVATVVMLSEEMLPAAHLFPPL